MKPRIVIIGGGILGATAAWALSRTGDQVTLLEKGGLVSGASGANLGQLSLIDRLEPWHMEAALSSLRLYASLPAQAGLEYQQTGGVVTLEDEAQYAASRPVAAQLAALGIPVEYRTGPEARQTEPALDSRQIKALLYCPQEGKLNPLSTTWAFLDMAREAGAELHPHTPVTGFVQTGERIAKVCTTQGDFEADLVVNAAGAWSKEVAGLLGLNLPLDYHRAAAFVSQPVPPIIRGPVVGGGMFLKRTSMHMRRHIGTGCVQTACGSILIAQATEDAPVDSREVTLPGLCLVAKRFLRYFPTLEDLEIVRAWACVTPFTPDGLPVFGFSRAVPNFFTVAGFKGAFTTAPAVALHLAEAIHHGRVWDAHFSPDRTGEEQTPCST